MKLKNIFCPASYKRRLIYFSIFMTKKTYQILQVIANSILIKAKNLLSEEQLKKIEISMLPILGCRMRKIEREGEKEPIFLHVTNALTAFRADTFYTKEPETIRWIDNFARDSTLWDIGANVGIYSIYAAKTRNCNVYAFEPSVFNLELLAKNIFVNGLTNNITIIPLALAESCKTALFQMGGDDGLEQGGACSSFGVDFDFAGNHFKADFAYSLMGMTGDAIWQMGNISLPQYIKIDVDGIEHYILKGMRNLLQQPSIKSILIEGNDDFQSQVKEIHDILSSYRFIMKSKEHGELFDNGGAYSKTFNQIWER